MRSLQFILDTAKDIDPLKINTIWSQHHQLKQLRRDGKSSEYIDTVQQNLDDAIAESKLPIELKNALIQDISDDYDYEQGSFGHFVNNYYQTRRKARDGRYFIFQTKKNKWIGAKLLTLCSHKPRQKRYQMLRDLANIFQIDYGDLLKKIAIDDSATAKDKIKDLETWLNFEDERKSNRTLKGVIIEAGKQQKTHKGSLKSNLEYALYKEKTKINPTISKEEKGLIKLNSQAKQWALTIAEKLWSDAEEQKAKAEKFSSIFSFAQIDNIVFKERSGFGKTCPVCSCDNGSRMQTQQFPSELKYKDSASCARLSALSIRLIDGVVMRICDKIANRVSSKVWEQIQPQLEVGNKVSLPLILEQNRFNFEPGLKQIKGKKAEAVSTDSKQERIKADVQNTCPYTGQAIGEDGEIDHITPRSSKWGTLNDEANLMYCSSQGNKTKGEKNYTLKNLAVAYKQKLFSNKDDKAIKDFIYRHILGINETEQQKNLAAESFVFGKYQNFVNLKKDEQLAFRHALFLCEDDSDNKLRSMVISAINNRNRTIVNGTQRYLAQIIADKIYGRAKHHDKASLLSFDFFEVTPEAITIEARQQWENEDAEIKKFQKVKGVSQQSYSHLIDAQIAFLIACHKHQHQGAMGVVFDGTKDTITSGVNAETGEIIESDYLKYLNATKIQRQQFQELVLEPESNDNKIANIVSNKQSRINLSKVITRPVFGENALGEKYRPIVEVLLDSDHTENNSKLYLGYPKKVGGNQYDLTTFCSEIKANKQWRIILATEKYYQLTKEDTITTSDNQSGIIRIYTIKMVDKKYRQINIDSQRYFSKLQPQYNQDQEADVKQIVHILKNKCRYYTKKTDLIEIPAVLNKAENKKYPFYQNWLDFDAGWRTKLVKNGAEYKTEKIKDKYFLNIKGVEDLWQEHCRQFLNIPTKRSHHSKVRKDFTMIAIGTSQGALLRIKRKGGPFQLMPMDNNTIGKKRVNFIIKNSRNLANASIDPVKELRTAINTENKWDIKDQVVSTNYFFKESFLNKIGDNNLKVIILKPTEVQVEYFPLSIFKEYLGKDYQDDKKIIEFSKKNKNGEPHPFWIITQQKPSVSKLKTVQVENATVSFKFTYKSAGLKKWYDKWHKDQ